MYFRSLVTPSRHFRSLERRRFVFPPFFLLSADRTLVPLFCVCRSHSLASLFHFSSLPPFLWLAGVASLSGLDAAVSSSWLAGAMLFLG